MAYWLLVYWHDSRLGCEWSWVRLPDRPKNTVSNLMSAWFFFCLSLLHNLCPKFANRWISRIGSLSFWWNPVQRKALMHTICSREIFNKQCRQQQNFDSDPKEAWHFNYVTFTPIAKHFMLYCRLIYTLSMLYVRLTIKVNEGIPESFKVGWYPHKITGSSHLNCKLRSRKFAYGHLYSVQINTGPAAKHFLLL